MKTKSKSLKLARRLYLICSEEERPFAREHIERLYNKYNSVTVSSMGDAEMVLVIGGKSESMTQDLLEAEKLGLSIEYMDQSLMSEAMKEDMLEKQDPIRSADRGSGYEYVRERTASMER